MQDLNLIPSTFLKGVGPGTADRLQKLEIYSIQDILFHLPFRYQDRTAIRPMVGLRMGEQVVLEGEIIELVQPRVGRTKLLCKITDGRGKIHARFFHMAAQQIKSFQVGKKVRCLGEIRLGPLGLELIHPELYFLAETQALLIDENLTPIYPTTEGLSQTVLRNLVRQSLALLNEVSLKEYLPKPSLNKLNFPTLMEALHYVHQPPKHASIELLEQKTHIAHQRLIFEELLAHRLSSLHLKSIFQMQKAIAISPDREIVSTFLKQLPFKLTAAQTRVTQEILNDLARPLPMLRLVQGDVGSGKTIVAALSLLQIISDGNQGALLAPTELLAEQHFQSFKKWFEPFSIQVGLLTSQMKAKDKAATLQALAEGKLAMLIGTHAILENAVQFKRLALIVVDEQHRFGVLQRARLREKGQQEGFFPHQLIMTATPIPRTLAMSAYADLDCSIIDELPPKRQPVVTRIIANTRRDDIWLRIQEERNSGRQIYWVCTLIEESDVLQSQAATHTFELLKAALPNLRVGLLHGRMKASEKEIIMAQFKTGILDLLVATTVIEVGVDVPNASLMIIENAERLGLAQLHQLRGRVGRGAVESICILLYQAPLSALAKARLGIMRETNDGFLIAEKDLELRGPGEMLGTKQTGDIPFRIANLLRDGNLLSKVPAIAELLEKDFPECVQPLIKRWLKQSERCARV
jgi:ATP-dependent DNA helicase RecG